MATYVATIIAALLILIGALTSFYLGKRSANDVLNELVFTSGGQATSHKTGKSTFRSHRSAEKKSRQLSLGLLTKRDLNSFMLKQILLPVLPCVVVLTLFFSTSLGTHVNFLPAVVLSTGGGLLIHRLLLKSRKHTFIREIEFMLPVVMERLVMGAEAGLDVIASIKKTTELERLALRSTSNGPKGKVDPVTLLLERVYKLSEAGIPLDKALSEISNQVESAALRHAFIHLGEAYSKGGEIVLPLRELSDSTQQYFQETVEEEIAKLPVKATMPLVCTFTGLLIIFVTTPLMQVMKITSEVTLR